MIPFPILMLLGFLYDYLNLQNCVKNDFFPPFLSCKDWLLGSYVFLILICPPLTVAAVVIQVPYISDFQMYPFMYTRPFPSQNLEEDDSGPGIYAIPCLPYMSPMAGFSPNTLIPLRYKIPT